MALKIVIRCDKHANYTGRGKPRSDCRGCLELHKFRHAALASYEHRGIGGFTHDASGAIDGTVHTVYVSQ